MDKFYNERNEFDEGLYDDYVKARRRRIKALLFAGVSALGIAGGVKELTKEEIVLNDVKLYKGQYDTLFNPETLDVAVLTGLNPSGERVESDYCYNVLSNKIVPREKYEAGYYSIDLMNMIKDGSVDSIKFGINKYTVASTPRKIGDAAQVQFALEYMANKDRPRKVEEYIPNFDVVMINDLKEEHECIPLSPVQDLALYNSAEHAFAYIHLDREQCYDLISGNPINIEDFVGSSPVNVYSMIEHDSIPYQKLPGGGENGKDAYVISSHSLAEHVFYNFSNGTPITIGGK